MEDYILIPALDFCKSHRVQTDLLEQYHSHGLVNIIYRQQDLFIPEPEVRKLEKIIVFHRELDINLEGIETILELLNKVEHMQQTITQLENKLQRFTG